MDILYKVAQCNGHWGFWCDAFEEKEMLKLVKRDDSVVGGFAHSELGARRVMAVDDNRKKIVASLPKTRTFFAFNPAHDGMDETWSIDWVGHIGCFPYEGPRTIMLQTCEANTIVAKGIKPDDQKEMWVSVVEILEDMPVPLTTCCDV